MHRVKCMVVGDPGVGKTSLILNFINETFSNEHLPTVLDNYAATFTLDNKIVCMNVWDICGDAKSSEMRKRNYVDTDVLILCFSTNNRKSFESIKKIWCPEIKLFCRDTPIILVGTKSDSIGSQDAIINLEGLAMMDEIGAKKYLECSALNGFNTKEIFTEVARIYDFCPKPKLVKRRQMSCAYM